jgi:hypothetical protein
MHSQALPHATHSNLLQFNACSSLLAGGKFPPVPKQTIQSDGANLDCLVDPAFAIDASANLRQMQSACGARADVPLLMTASVQRVERQAGVGFNVGNFFWDV